MSEFSAPEPASALSWRNVDTLSHELGAEEEGTVNDDPPAALVDASETIFLEEEDMATARCEGGELWRQYTKRSEQTCYVTVGARKRSKCS